MSKLYEYVVYYEKNLDSYYTGQEFAFGCQAEDALHAIEQATDSEKTECTIKVMSVYMEE